MRDMRIAAPGSAGAPLSNYTRVAFTAANRPACIFFYGVQAKSCHAYLPGFDFYRQSTPLAGSSWGPAAGRGAPAFNLPTPKLSGSRHILPDLDASILIVAGQVGYVSQGTLVDFPGRGRVIVTHDHFIEGALAPNSALFYKQKGGESFSGYVDLARSRPDANSYPEINIIPVGDAAEMEDPKAVRPAPLAVVKNIRVNDRVDVVYNAAIETGKMEIKYASMRVTKVSEHAIQVADPQNLINPGDSGGAVYFNGELIGVIWSIGNYDFGPAANISILRAN